MAPAQTRARPPRAEARRATAAEKGTGAAPKPPGSQRGGRAPRPKGAEVSYSGRIFRSRLEARWAAFLDLMAINWDYEPSHYQVGPALWYLPDFYLPDLGVWLEVKGAPFMDAASMAKVASSVAGPQRIPMREAPYEPAESILLGGGFKPLPEGMHPVHVVCFRDSDGTAGFAPLRFVFLDGHWMLAPAGEPFASIKATGVPNRRRPPADFLDEILTPDHLAGTPDPFLAYAYRAARALRFDETEGTLKSGANNHEVLTRLVRRRAGRPLPTGLWPKNLLKV